MCLHSRTKGANDWFLRVTGVFGTFCSLKKYIEKDLKKIQIYCIKVKNCSKITWVRYKNFSVFCHSRIEDRRPKGLKSTYVRVLIFRDILRFLVAMLHQNDRFAIWFGLFRTHDKINRLAMNDYSTLAFNLTTLSFILFVVLLSCPFCATERTKELGTRKEQSAGSLLTSYKQHSSVEPALSLKLAF